MKSTRHRMTTCLVACLIAVCLIASPIYAFSNEAVQEASVAVTPSQSQEQPPTSPPPDSEPPVESSGPDMPPVSGESPETSQEIPPEEPPPCGGNIAYSFQELADWIREHQQTGGKISLGADITVEDTHNLVAGLPIQLDAGPYQISVAEGRSFIMGGPFHITAAPTPGRAVFLVPAGGLLMLDETIELRVTGDNATGVRVSSPSGLRCNYASISVEGVGAEAVDAPNGIELTLARLSAIGLGSAALSSGGDTDVTYSTLTAMGDGAQSVRTDGTLLLDSVFAEPMPEGAEIITRTAAPLRSYPYASQFYAFPGKPVELPRTIAYILTAEGRSSFQVMAGLDWGPLEPSGGTEKLACAATVLPPIPEVRLPGLLELEEELHIVDPALPRLIYYSVRSRSFNLLTPVADDAELALLLSIDGGLTFSDAPLLSFDDISLRIQEPPEVGVETQYQLRIRDGDKTLYSNILSVNVTEEDGGHSTDLGGERVDSDHGGYDPTPPPLGQSSPPSQVPPANDGGAPSDSTPPLTPLPTVRPTADVPPSPSPDVTCAPWPDLAEAQVAPGPELQEPAPTTLTQDVSIPGAPAIGREETPTPASADTEDGAEAPQDERTFTGGEFLELARLHPSGLSFFAGRAQLFLPANLLVEMALAEDDTVALSFLETEDNVWSIALSKNTLPVSLKGAQLRFQLTSRDMGAYSCQDGDGNWYDSTISGSRLSFTISGQGTYTLYVQLSPTPEPSPSSAVEPPTPSPLLTPRAAQGNSGSKAWTAMLVPLLGCGTVLIAAFLWRQRK